MTILRKKIPQSVRLSKSSMRQRQPKVIKTAFLMFLIFALQISSTPCLLSSFRSTESTADACLHKGYTLPSFSAFVSSPMLLKKSITYCELYFEYRILIKSLAFSLYAFSSAKRFERLHFPFPVTRIFFPTLSEISKSETFLPLLPKAHAQAIPEAPAPIIATSVFFIISPTQKGRNNPPEKSIEYSADSTEHADTRKHHNNSCDKHPEYNRQNT